jgi:hypothetical protein
LRVLNEFQARFGCWIILKTVHNHSWNVVIWVQDSWQIRTSFSFSFVKRWCVKNDKNPKHFIQWLCSRILKSSCSDLMKLIMLDLSTEEMNHQPEKFRNLKPNNTSSKSYKKLLEFKLKPCWSFHYKFMFGLTWRNLHLRILLTCNT